MDGQLSAWQSEGQGFESPRVHQILVFESRSYSSDNTAPEQRLTHYLTHYVRRVASVEGRFEKPPGPAEG